MKRLPFIQSPNLIALLSISITAIAIYGFYYVPKLITDDWPRVIFDNGFGLSNWIFLDSLRPLEQAPFKAIHAFFGLNIHIFHLINLVLLIGIAALIFSLINRQVPDLYPFGLIVALLALVYPANYTLTWITMIQNHLAWLLSLLGMGFLLSFAEQGKAYHLALALSLMFFPLFMYEAPLGISAAWCFLMVLSRPGISTKRRLLLLSPIPLLGGYIWIRALLQTRLSNQSLELEKLVSLLPVEPLVILQRFPKITVLLDAWAEANYHFLRSLQIPVAAGILSMGILIACSAGLMLLLTLLLRFRKTGLPLNSSWRSTTIRDLMVIPLVSFTFILAGYFPVILAFPPTLEDQLTRVNAFSIPAAACFLVAIIGLASLLMVRSKQDWQVLLWAGAAPFLFLGFKTQLVIQHEESIAWRSQRNIWQSIFKLAPDIQDGTLVLLVLQDYKPRIYSHPPLYTFWDFKYGLQVFYENRSLNGKIYAPYHYLYCEAEPVFEGVKSWCDPNDIIPYDKVLIFVYNLRGDKLKLRNPGPGMPGYDPGQRILSEPDQNWHFRNLVGAY